MTVCVVRLLRGYHERCDHEIFVAHIAKGGRELAMVPAIYLVEHHTTMIQSGGSGLHRPQRIVHMLKYGTGNDEIIAPVSLKERFSGSRFAIVTGQRFE